MKQKRPNLVIIIFALYCSLINIRNKALFPYDRGYLPPLDQPTRLKIDVLPESLKKNSNAQDALRLKSVDMSTKSDSHALSFFLLNPENQEKIQEMTEKKGGLHRLGIRYFWKFSLAYLSFLKSNICGMMPRLPQRDDQASHSGLERPVQYDIRSQILNIAKPMRHCKKTDIRLEGISDYANDHESTAVGTEKDSGAQTIYLENAPDVTNAEVISCDLIHQGLDSTLPITLDHTIQNTPVFQDQSPQILPNEDPFTLVFQPEPLDNIQNFVWPDQVKTPVAPVTPVVPVNLVTPVTPVHPVHLVAPVTPVVPASPVNDAIDQELVWAYVYDVKTSASLVQTPGRSLEIPVAAIKNPPGPLIKILEQEEIPVHLVAPVPPVVPVHLVAPVPPVVPVHLVAPVPPVVPASPVDNTIDPDSDDPFEDLVLLPERSLEILEQEKIPMNNAPHTDLSWKTDHPFKKPLAPVEKPPEPLIAIENPDLLPEPLLEIPVVPVENPALLPEPLLEIPVVPVENPALLPEPLLEIENLDLLPEPLLELSLPTCEEIHGQVTYDNRETDEEHFIKLNPFFNTILNTVIKIYDKEIFFEMPQGVRGTVHYNNLLLNALNAFEENHTILDYQLFFLPKCEEIEKIHGKVTYDNRETDEEHFIKTDSFFEHIPIENRVIQEIFFDMPQPSFEIMTYSATHNRHYKRVEDRIEKPKLMIQAADPPLIMQQIDQNFDQYSPTEEQLIRIIFKNIESIIKKKGLSDYYLFKIADNRSDVFHGEVMVVFPPENARINPTEIRTVGELLRVGTVRDVNGMKITFQKDQKKWGITLSEKKDLDRYKTCVVNTVNINLLMQPEPDQPQSSSLFQSICNWVYKTAYNVGAPCIVRMDDNEITYEKQWRLKRSKNFSSYFFCCPFYYKGAELNDFGEMFNAIKISLIKEENNVFSMKKIEKKPDIQNYIQNKDSLFSELNPKKVIIFDDINREEQKNEEAKDLKDHGQAALKKNTIKILAMPAKKSLIHIPEKQPVDKKNAELIPVKAALESIAETVVKTGSATQDATAQQTSTQENSAKKGAKTRNVQNLTLEIQEQKQIYLPLLNTPKIKKVRQSHTMVQNNKENKTSVYLDYDSESMKGEQSVSRVIEKDDVFKQNTNH